MQICQALAAITCEADYTFQSTDSLKDIEGTQSGEESTTFRPAFTAKLHSKTFRATTRYLLLELTSIEVKRRILSNLFTS